MADLPTPPQLRRPLDPPNDIERRRPDRLVDDQNPVSQHQVFPSSSSSSSPSSFSIRAGAAGAPVPNSRNNDSTFVALSNTSSTSKVTLGVTFVRTRREIARLKYPLA
jgi:hypothetical protein